MLLSGLEASDGALIIRKCFRAHVHPTCEKINAVTDAVFLQTGRSDVFLWPHESVFVFVFGVISEDRYISVLMIIFSLTFNTHIVSYFHFSCFLKGKKGKNMFLTSLNNDHQIWHTRPFIYIYWLKLINTNWCLMCGMCAN